MLYTLNIHSDVCQFFSIELEKKTHEKAHMDSSTQENIN